jgi:CubicO group peptidase (beta-lactamase class C family)
MKLAIPILLFLGSMAFAAEDRIADIAGQWSVAYNNSAVHVYTFDKDGKMEGWQSDGEGKDVPLSGQIMEKDGRLLLNHFGDQSGQIPPLERITPQADGRLLVEHWNPRAGFFSGNNPDVLGSGVPARGKIGPGVEAIDGVMLAYLEKNGCSGATVCVTRGNKTYISRGYGWSDEKHKVPILPDTPMSIASCDKEMTMAAIRQLARDGKLDLNASVLKVLQTRPAGPIVDNRVWDITINHLLDGQAGWQGDPLTRADAAYAAIQGRNGVPGPDSLLSYDTRLGLVMVQRLAWTPGTKAEYDSFGYGMLKLIITRVSGQSYVDYLRTQLCRPYGVPELKWIRHGARQKGEPPQLWNGLIMEDPVELRMGVSMPALCTFMRCFWHGGEPAGQGSTSNAWGGSWDNATTIMLWRGDGINVAYSFNGRGASDDAQVPMHQAINWLLEEKKIPSQ